MKRTHIAFGLFIFSSYSWGQPSVITKLFHHKVPRSDVSLEMGSVVLYVTSKPTITVTTQSDGDQKRTIYFIPNVRLQPDLKAVVERIQKETDCPYRIVIEEVKKPQQGLQVALLYNPADVGISYELFDSITLQKGVAFRFFDKKTISRIQNAAKPIIRTAANIPKVIIDCGHGGHDMGAMGCNNRIEKEINLQVGLQVAQVLTTHNVGVELIRASDIACPLDMRTAFANQQDAHLLVSIHTNAAIDQSSSGIETHCLASSLFSDGDSTLSLAEQRLVKNALDAKYAQGSLLANTIHYALLAQVSSYKTVDRSIKQSVAQVLLGTTIPAVLVELGFLTHPRESFLLSQKPYQTRLAQGIASGILSYLKSL